jgi:hypothetical protein
LLPTPAIAIGGVKTPREQDIFQKIDFPDNFARRNSDNCLIYIYLSLFMARKLHEQTDWEIEEVEFPDTLC